MVTEIYGMEISPKIDSLIMPDNWPAWNCSRLVAGDSFSTFRLPLNSNGPIKSLAVEIKVTGRTLQRHNGLRCVRVQITFPGDCEPDTVTGGWMEIPW